MSDRTNAREAVLIERLFKAPIEMIWDMWTRPEQFNKWYSPEGFTISITELDVRVGGKRLVSMEMASPDGNRRMCTVGEHLELEPKTRLAYTETPSDSS